MGVAIDCVKMGANWCIKLYRKKWWGENFEKNHKNTTPYPNLGVIIFKPYMITFIVIYEYVGIFRNFM